MTISQTVLQSPGANAPPTVPGMIVRPERRRPIGIPIVLLVCACFGVLFTAYWFYVIGENVQFTPRQTAWFYSDACARMFLWLIVAFASILVLAGRRAGSVMLLAWSIAYLLWIPASAIGCASAGEPSPDMVLAVGFYWLVGSPLALGVGVIVPLCVWLMPPVLALICVHRSRRR